ncbi:MAG TPA: DedA family protein [Acidimicrobiales bacterium]|nr:DedA family protein [Acidimicrobiales bacterium]
MSDWVVDVIERLGAVGVGLLIFLENVLPPIPSEVILPFAGFTSRRGDLNIVAAWVAASAGSLAGALLLYGIGAVVGEERLRELSRKRWFVFFGEKDFDRGERFFDRYGNQVVFFARFVPLVRSVVSVPAGLDRMPLGRFALLTLAGSAIWNAVFIGAGWVLGDNWERVEGFVGPLSYLVVALLAVALVLLVVRKVRRSPDAV